MADLVLVSDPDVPPGMLVVKQGGRVIGAVCRGVVFGTEDIRHLEDRVIAEMRADPRSPLRSQRP